MKKKRKKVNIRASYYGDGKIRDISCPALDAQIKQQKLSSPEYIMFNGVLTRMEDLPNRD